MSRPPRRRRARPAAEGFDLAQLWFTIPIGAIIWRVYLAPDDSPCLDGLEGCTAHKSSSIFLDEDLEDSRLVAVLAHELVHACFSTSNEEHTAGVLGCEKTDVDAAEERVSVALGDKLIDGLQRAGLLRLPRRPR